MTKYAFNVFTGTFDLIEPKTVYVHDQSIAATEWIITHGLGAFLSVATVDTVNEEMVGSIEYLSADAITVRFTVAVAGKAYLS